MKKAIGVFFSLCMLGIAGMANAIPFTNAIDYSTADKNLDYIIINDSTSGVYTHTINFAPEAVKVDSAILSITFANANATEGNGTAKEIWLIYEDTDEGTGVQIGKLTGSPNLNGNTIGWITNIFDLSSLISQLNISGSSWKFGFTFVENTIGTDTFYLAKSELSGVYTADPRVGAESLPVPEPGTIILVSAGLIGLVVINRHKFRK